MGATRHADGRMTLTMERGQAVESVGVENTGGTHLHRGSLRQGTQKRNRRDELEHSDRNLAS